MRRAFSLPIRALLGLILAGLAVAAEATIALNPDVTQSNIRETICVPGYTKTVRPSTTYSNGVKRKLFREAGLDEAVMSAFELDHHVPLALGGHPRSLNNLMLQPWDGANGAKKKDRLEVKLQCLVCTGQLRLAEAQQAIYTDWTKAYRSYAPVKCHRSGR